MTSVRQGLKESYLTTPTKAANLQTPHLILEETYERLIDALVCAASTLHGTPELVERNAVMIALGEHGNVFPDLIRPHMERAACR